MPCEHPAAVLAGNESMLSLPLKSLCHPSASAQTMSMTLPATACKRARWELPAVGLMLTGAPDQTLGGPCALFGGLLPAP